MCLAYSGWSASISETIFQAGISSSGGTFSIVVLTDLESGKDSISNFGAVMSSSSLD
jgi:hypothetical protein